MSLPATQLLTIWSRFLLLLRIFLGIYAQAAAYPSPKDETLSPRTDALYSTVVPPWPKDPVTQSHQIPYCFDINYRANKYEPREVETMEDSFRKAIHLWKNSIWVTGMNHNPIKYPLPVQSEFRRSCSSTTGILRVSVVPKSREIYTTQGFGDGRPTMKVGLKLLERVYILTQFYVHDRKDEVIGRMAHELGRAMGLPNEVQVNPASKFHNSLSERVSDLIRIYFGLSSIPHSRRQRRLEEWSK